MFGGLEYQLLDKGDRSSMALFNEAQKFMNQARRNPSFSSVYTSFTASLPQQIVRIQEDKAMAQGVSISEIYNTLAAQFGSTYINDFNKYGRVYRVFMQADSEYRASMSDLNKIYVKNKNGKMLPITSVLTTEAVEEVTQRQ